MALDAPIHGHHSGHLPPQNRGTTGIYGHYSANKHYIPDRGLPVMTVSSGHKAISSRTLTGQGIITGSGTRSSHFGQLPSLAITVPPSPASIPSLPANNHMLPLPCPLPSKHHTKRESHAWVSIWGVAPSHYHTSVTAVTCLALCSSAQELRVS